MGRPPSTDRKEIITLRLRKSVLDAYKAGGEDYRARMEVAIEGALAKAAEPPPKAVAPAPAGKVRKAAAEPPEAARGVSAHLQLGPSKVDVGSRLKKR